MVVSVRFLSLCAARHAPSLKKHVPRRVVSPVTPQRIQHYHQIFRRRTWHYEVASAHYDAPVFMGSPETLHYFTFHIIYCPCVQDLRTNVSDKQTARVTFPQ